MDNDDNGGSQRKLAYAALAGLLGLWSGGLLLGSTLALRGHTTLVWILFSIGMFAAAVAGVQWLRSQP